MLRIVVVGSARMLLGEMLANLLRSMGLGVSLSHLAAKCQLEVIDAVDATWLVSSDMEVPPTTESADFRLAPFHPDYVGTDVCCFALNTLAAECSYHVLATPLHSRGQRLEMWGAGYRFAEVTLRMATPLAVSSAAAALIAALRCAELFAIAEPLGPLVDCLGAFESQKAARWVAQVQSENRDAVLYQFEAEPAERQRHLQELAAVWRPIRVEFAAPSDFFSRVFCR